MMRFDDGLSPLASGLNSSMWPTSRSGGVVSHATGSAIECTGLEQLASVGDICRIERSPNKTLGPANGTILAEVMSVSNERCVLLPYDVAEGISLGNKVWIDRNAQHVMPSHDWCGRVLDALSQPIDGKGPLVPGSTPYPLMAAPIPAHKRSAMGQRVELGVKSLDLFTPCCEGQRLGVFAGSGVGKSTLVSMVAKHSNADILVIGLIGERGRELHEFLNETLGPEGLKRSIVVVATSDMPAMMRRRAAYLSMAIAEHFRNEGQKVLCMLDSVTRFAMALREIYLAAGEPPTTKGYPPSVFSELPRLLERAGPGSGAGSISGLFSVLVEGDDTNEPVSDTVRGILDGHVIMDRKIAEQGIFPAVDVLKSISRSAPGCYTSDERKLVENARRMMRLHSEMLDLIQLGAYQQGSNPDVDRAIVFNSQIEPILNQAPDSNGSPHAAWKALAAIASD